MVVDCWDHGSLDYIALAVLRLKLCPTYLYSVLVFTTYLARYEARALCVPLVVVAGNSAQPEARALIYLVQIHRRLKYFQSRGEDPDCAHTARKRFSSPRIAESTLCYGPGPVRDASVHFINYQIPQMSTSK